MSNLKIEEKFTVAAPVEHVWQFLLNPELVAGCLPGAALRGQEGADTYLGTMKIKVGPVTSEFKGKATLSDIDPTAHRLKLTGTGDDVSGGGSARMIMDLGVSAHAEGSEVQVVADVEIAGKLVRFGRGMIEGISKQLFKQFVERARERITSAAAAEEPAGSAAPAADAATATATPAAASDASATPTAAAAPAAPDDKPAAAPVIPSGEAGSSPAAPATRETSETSAPPATNETTGTGTSVGPTETSETVETKKPPTAGDAPVTNETGKAGTEGATAAEPTKEAAESTKKEAAEPTKEAAAATKEDGAGKAAAPATSRGPAPQPEASDITTGVLPRPKPRPLAITVPKQEPEALDAGSLVFRALWEWIKSLFRRLLGRGK